jgi:hypothetical protein
MATARQQVRTAPQRDGRAADGGPSEFVVFQSNAGDYRWEIVSGTGAPVAQSVPFASLEDAEQSAVRVREGAGATRLGPRSAAGPVRPLVAASQSRNAKGR